jgi:predicted nuclease with TOPRIM domain
MPPLARRRAVAKSEMEEQMNMVEVLSEELGAKELKIMKLEEETKKLEEENKELKENLMKCEVNWLYYWSDEEMGEEAYYHPDWWQEEPCRVQNVMEWIIIVIAQKVKYLYQYH